jgi:co-chaperonin GroES (HSP10)
MVVVGDRTLVIADNERDRTEHGLYLPPGVKEREKVQGGYVVNVGPGYPIPNPNYLDQESWSTAPKEPVKYIPLQAEVGDYAIFLKDQAVEIEVDGTKYLIVPQAAILLLLRPNTLGAIDPGP